MTSFNREFRSADRYKEAVDAAQTLGLTVEEHRFRGAWVDDRDEPVFMRRERDPVVEKVGRKYFYAEVDEEITPIKPATTAASGPGKVIVTFGDR